MREKGDVFACAPQTSQMDTLMSFTIVSIHTMDPRGTKVGGIETHIRHLLRHHPADARLMLVGIDERGDLPTGRISEIDIEGRTISFLPLMRVEPGAQINAAASLASSVTLRFAVRLMVALPMLRRLLAKSPAIVEVERLELVLPARLLGHPVMALLHNEGQRGDKMDSILGRHWWVHEAAEWLAVRLAAQLFCVTQKLRERVAARHPAHAAKIGMRTVSVDCDLFSPSPFDISERKLRVVFAGRLDAFKDPPLMFDVAARLHARLNGAFEFHYCGASDPTVFGEFAAISAFTIRHGALTPRQVAAVMRATHVGILTSYYEGMPCFLLELLASGRPYAGVHLPQFDQIVRSGHSGEMVARSEDRAQTAAAVSEAVIAAWNGIRLDIYTPEGIAASVASFAVTRQLAEMFALMRRLAHAGQPPVSEPRFVAAGE